MKKDKINQNFQDLSIDYLYHLGIDTSMDLGKIFSGVKYVIFIRSNDDVALIANHFAKSWYQIVEASFTFQPIFKTERYHLYKIGPAIAVSHGVGMPSMLVCLNEITKLMVHLNYLDVIFLKIGSSAGLGVKEGEAVIAEEVVNTKFETIYSSIECGVKYKYQTNLDLELVNELVLFNQKYSKIKLTRGKTMSAFDYYEEQAHMDGALELEYNVNERDKYLQLAQANGVKSLDMEALAFAGFCNQLSIRACLINNIVGDRLGGDEVLLDRQSQLQAKANVGRLVTEYIIHKLR